MRSFVPRYKVVFSGGVSIERSNVKSFKPLSLPPASPDKLRNKFVTL